MSYFATALQVILDRRQLTQRRLAEMAKVDTGGLSRYVNGEINPTVETLEQLCQALADPGDRAEIVIGHLQDQVPPSATELVRIVSAIGTPRIPEDEPMPDPALPPKLLPYFRRLRALCARDPVIGAAVKSLVDVIDAR